MTSALFSKTETFKAARNCFFGVYEKQESVDDLYRVYLLKLGCVVRAILFTFFVSCNLLARTNDIWRKAYVGRCEIVNTYVHLKEYLYKTAATFFFW